MDIINILMTRNLKEIPCNQKKINSGIYRKCHSTWECREFEVGFFHPVLFRLKLRVLRVLRFKVNVKLIKICKYKGFGL